MTSFARVFIGALSFFLVMNAFESSEAKGYVSQRLIIRSKDPVLILFEEKGEIRPVIVPEKIKESMRDIYPEISLEDLSGDGVPEVVATMRSGAVNRCSKIYRYDKGQGSLVEVGFQSMPGMLGHYERYAGMGEWETLDIEPNEQGVDMAIFSLMRIGNPETLLDSGPAATGGLSVRLDGKGAYRSAIPEDIEKDCSLQIVQGGVDIRVIESFRDGCQNYGGMGVHVAGIWRKIAQIVINKETGTCVTVRDGTGGSGPTGGLICMNFSYEQRRAAQKQGVNLGEPYMATLARLTRNGWRVDGEWLSEESANEGGTHKLPICGQGWDAICHVVMEKGGAHLQLTFSGTNDGFPLVDIEQLVSGAL